MSKPVIFLDVDGVLNHQDCPEWQSGSWRVLDQSCVFLVRRICEETGAVIVLSSSWRTDDDAVALLRTIFGDRIIGQTPLGREEGGLFVAVPRRDEIQAWLTAHPAEWRVCVIDDDTDAEVPGLPFVRTSFEHGGLTRWLAKKVLAALLPKEVAA